VLTCNSTNSRNFSLGVGLGQGKSPADLLADRRTVAEGAHTAPVLQQAAAQAGVDMPVCEAVCALLAGKPVGPVVEALLARPLKEEAR
jgi:glycerol-3-phosphate dehydrogenase (NAD(P)+)